MGRNLLLIQHNRLPRHKAFPEKEIPAISASNECLLHDIHNDLMSICARRSVEHIRGDDFVAQVRVHRHLKQFIRFENLEAGKLVAHGVIWLVRVEDNWHVIPLRLKYFQ